MLDLWWWVNLVAFFELRQWWKELFFNGFWWRVSRILLKLLFRWQHHQTRIFSPFFYSLSLFTLPFSLCGFTWIDEILNRKGELVCIFWWGEVVYHFNRKSSVLSIYRELSVHFCEMMCIFHINDIGWVFAFSYIVWCMYISLCICPFR